MKATNQKSPIKYISKEKVDALINAINTKSKIRDKAIFTIAFWRGLRASEVGLLRMGDYNFKTKTLLVRRLKDSNPTEYPILKAEIAAIEKWLASHLPKPNLTFDDWKETPLFPSKYVKTTKWTHRGVTKDFVSSGVKRSYLDKVIRKYGPLVGIPLPLCHFHTLKHSLCTYLLDEGIPIETVKEWVGHKSIRTTLLYAKVTQKKMGRLVAGLDEKLEKGL